MLARQIRWSFLAAPDSRPGAQVYWRGTEPTRYRDTRDRQCRDVAEPDSAGGPREGCFWVEPPRRGDALPPLSVVITTALAVGAGGGD